MYRPQSPTSCASHVNSDRDAPYLKSRISIFFMRTRIQITAAMGVEHSIPAFLLFFGSASYGEEQTMVVFMRSDIAPQSAFAAGGVDVKAFYLSRSASTSYILGRSVAKKAEPGCIFTVTAHDQFRETDKELLLPEPLNTPCSTIRVVIQASLAV